MQIDLKNIQHDTSAEDGLFYSFDLTIDGLKIVGLMEWDNVINGDEIDSWFDVQGKDKIESALEGHATEEEIERATELAWIEIEERLKRYSEGLNLAAATQFKVYQIVFRDNTGSHAVEAIAHSCGGAWRNSVQQFDGKHDIAFVEVPQENADHLEDILDQDENVVSYGER